MPKPFPEEFRRDVIAVARKGEAKAPLRQIAKDFGIFEGSPHRWLKFANHEDSVGTGTTTTSSDESVELREARKRIKLAARCARPATTVVGNAMLHRAVTSWPLRLVPLTR